ncbi:hypothetical protein [Streptomyces bohaiensis]|uniref:hypothetical protein n=1 Tax=Streptomyces bohaiensis TaxID=1431344 RepID=UPI0028B059AD|nr:hypothetical protein [Streptomyces bohaiensis]
MSRAIGTDGAVLWLAAAAADPERCRRRWARGGGPVELSAGARWDALVLPSHLGIETLAVLHRTGGGAGPVLLDRGAGTVAYFVPPGSAGAWLATGVRALGTGTRLLTPRPDVVAGEVRWLVGPDGSGRLTDLGRLESAMHEAFALTFRRTGLGRRTAPAQSPGAPRRSLSPLCGGEAGTTRPVAGRSDGGAATGAVGTDGGASRRG